MDSPHNDTRALQQRLGALDAVVRSIGTVAGAPGLSLRVSHRGRVVHKLDSGFANVQDQVPVDGRTRFAIGTLAKTFTAAAVGALVDEGRLAWDTPVKSVVPELQTASAAVTENLTVVDLLSHRSGLGRSNYWWQGAEAVLLLDKRDLVPIYNKLPVTGQFRASWAYSNWGYALVGEMVERLTGTTYADYLQKAVLTPLGLRSTTLDDPRSLSADASLARPYAAMDNGSPHLLPQPPVHGGTIMAPALGGLSSADDLSAYSMALLAAFRHESGLQASVEPCVVKQALQQLSAHISTAPALQEKSYAMGWYRTQLPNTVLGMGWNSLYVDEMPRIVPRHHVGPLIAHGGSLPGYHVSIAMLPATNSSVVVCTNSIALGDVSGWVSMAVLEALVDTPQPSDFLALASEAAKNAASNVMRFEARLQAARAANGRPPGARVEYVGTYRDERRGWIMVVRPRDTAPSGMEVAFQGLDSQAWPLSHYENDTFVWLASRQEQARRGRMVTYPLVPDHFKLQFQASRGRGIDRVVWRHEAGAPADQQYFLKIA